MKIKLYTDGSCNHTTRKGGWAAIAVYTIGGELKTKLFSGGGVDVTNNRMEITAVLEPLKVIAANTEVEVVADSQLVIGWLSKNWKCNIPENAVIVNEIKKIVKDKNLKLTFTWTKGHANDYYNELCDQEAKKWL